MRWMLGGGAVAAVQMSLFVTVVGAGRPGYDAQRNWISQLSLGPGGWLAAVNLATCGAWLIVCAAGLRAALDPGAAGRWAVRLVRWCGGCLVVLAVVPIDPGLGYPPGSAAVHTAAGVAHQAVALVLGVAGTAAAVLLGRCSRAALPWAPRAGLLVAAVMAAAFAGATVLVKLDEAGVLPGTPSGLLERVALFTGLAWIGVVSTALYGRSSSPRVAFLAGDPALRQGDAEGPGQVGGVGVDGGLHQRGQDGGAGGGPPVADRHRGTGDQGGRPG